LFPAEYELAKTELFAEIIWKRVNVGKGKEGYQYGQKFVQIPGENYWKLRELRTGRFK
jgi:hypothetical protein